MSESCSFCWLASLYKYQNQYTEVMAIHTPFQNNKYGWLNEIKLYGKFWIRTSPNHLEKEDGYRAEVLGGPQASNTFIFL